MKITHNVAPDLHPIFISLHQYIGVILDFGIWPPARRDLHPGEIAVMLYRFALSFPIKLIHRLPTRKAANHGVF